MSLCHTQGGKNDTKLTEEEDHAASNVRLSPPGSGERRANVSDLAPVECDDRHSEARDGTEELVDDDIVGGDPADPVEIREGAEDVAREEVPAEGTEEAVEEEAFTRDTTARTDTGVLLRVQRVEQGAGDEVGGPDHGRGLDEEAASNTTDRETNLREEGDA